ncbi:MAG: hypothetical protein M1409_01685 [Actinobacteria bacterium]|nr:hypothetical protein [Actinomycetota bacterium]
MNLENKTDKIRENEIKALLHLEKNRPDKAELILKKNLESGTSSTTTYDLLLRIYQTKKDYPSLIKTLNDCIKNSENKGIYRELRKTIIFTKLLEDINAAEDCHHEDNTPQK